MKKIIAALNAVTFALGQCTLPWLPMLGVRTIEYGEDYPRTQQMFGLTTWLFIAFLFLVSLSFVARLFRGRMARIRTTRRSADSQT